MNYICKFDNTGPRRLTLRYITTKCWKEEGIYSLKMVRKLIPSIKLSEKWWGMTPRGPDLVWRSFGVKMLNMKIWLESENEGIYSLKMVKNDPKMIQIIIFECLEDQLILFECFGSLKRSKSDPFGPKTWQRKWKFWTKMQKREHFFT